MTANTMVCPGKTQVPKEHVGGRVAGPLGPSSGGLLWTCTGRGEPVTVLRTAPVPGATHAGQGPIMPRLWVSVLALGKPRRPVPGWQLGLTWQMAKPRCGLEPLLEVLMSGTAVSSQGLALLPVQGWIPEATSLEHCPLPLPRGWPSRASIWGEPGADEHSPRACVHRGMRALEGLLP